MKRVWILSFLLSLPLFATANMDVSKQVQLEAAIPVFADGNLIVRENLETGEKDFIATEKKVITEDNKENESLRADIANNFNQIASANQDGLEIDNMSGRQAFIYLGWGWGNWNFSLNYGFGRNYNYNYYYNYNPYFYNWGGYRYWCWW